MRQGYGWTRGGTWDLLDLDGDRLPEFVVMGERDGTREVEVFGIEDRAPYWRVHGQGQGGFEEAPGAWWVPRIDPVGSYDQGMYAADGDSWTTMDLDGDDLLDVVIASSWDPDLGLVTFHDSSYDQDWLVYRGGS